jgi:hypothetical protein
MIAISFGQLGGLCALILFVWSAVNIWASWSLSRIMRSLTEERRELRRWKRLSILRDRQQRDWN